MAKKITKAIIPAAGLGTRMLPIARAVPKEMLPIVDRPAVSYLVEEAVNAGCEDILIITNRDKDAIEDYFDYSVEYEKKLRDSGKNDKADEMRRIADMANVYFLRQKETRGLGHAVARARSFVGDDPFYVLYGDDIIFSETPVCTQLLEAYEKYGKPAVGVKEVSDELIVKYCSLKTEHLDKNMYGVTDMIEKPPIEKKFSNFSILGRVLLTPEIFDVLDMTPPGAGGEIQLTDAMRVLAQKSGFVAVDFEGERFDMGAKLGFLMANVKMGVKHPETGREFAEFLKKFAKTL
ncbi:MAG: UTP--glucose-1-phosphate uridylyltransferase GalU [Clostridia bacterium]|nr:UTP--glucose-1-phosphate uridylyltransferase GalU [Clostridia bacterium]